MPSGHRDGKGVDAGDKRRCWATSCSSPQGWQEHESHGLKPLTLGAHTQALRIPPSLPPQSAQSYLCMQDDSADSWLGTQLSQDNFPPNLLLLFKLVKSFLAKPFWPRFLLEPAELL